jgi:hypothetical protein
MRDSLKENFKRIVLVSGILGSTLILFGCSYFAEFVVINNSANEVVVYFEFGRPGERIPGFPQAMYKSVSDVSDQDARWSEFPDRVEWGSTCCSVKARLLPGEALLLTRVDIREVRGHQFGSGIKNLTIFRADGSVTYSGADVFRSFTPENYSWFWPSAYLRYKIDLR